MMEITRTRISTNLEIKFGKWVAKIEAKKQKLKEKWLSVRIRLKELLAVPQNKQNTHNSLGGASPFIKQQEWYNLTSRLLWGLNYLIHVSYLTIPKNIIAPWMWAVTKKLFLNINLNFYPKYPIIWNYIENIY
jgi:hypothetical protein